MTTIELIDQKEQLQIRAEAILSGAEKESRKLTEDESNCFNTLVNEIKSIDTQITEINDNLNKRNNIKKTMSDFSILKAVSARANGKQFDEATQEVINAGKAEMRKAGLNADGHIVIPMEYRADI